MDKKEVFVNYNDEKNRNDAGELVVRCDCGHRFDFQTKPRGFCPGCGGEIVGYKASNVPMEEVPLGYQAFLFNKYEEYRDYYYGDGDHWGEIFPYKRAIYNNDKPEMFENHIKDVFEGWCYVNGYTPVYCHKNDKDVYMGYETPNLSIHHMVKQDLGAIIAKECIRIKQAVPVKEKIRVISDNYDLIYENEADDEGYFAGKNIIKAIREDLCPERADEDYFDGFIKEFRFNNYKRFKDKGQLTFDQICDVVNAIEEEFGTGPFDAEIYS